MTISCSNVSECIGQMHVLGSKDSILRQIVSSSLGSFITILTLNPLNVIKVHLQKQSLHSQTIKATISSVYNANGIGGFWAGTSSGLLMSVPNTVMYMVCYEQAKAVLSLNPSSNLQVVAPAVAGIVARAIAVTLISPLELTRTLQTGSSSRTTTISSTLSGIIEQNGIKGLYKGWWATILRDCPFSGIYWFSFEFLKPKFKILTNRICQKENNQLLATFCSGATSGCLAAVITHPFDVVKTNQQLSAIQGANSTISSFGYIFKSFGWKGLFRGLTLRLFTVMPSSGIMITVYEFVKSFDL